MHFAISLLLLWVARSIAIRDAYWERFHEVILRPAIYESQANSNCRSEPHITTTAYLRISPNRSTLLTIYLTPDAHTVLRSERREVLTPAGVISVLVVLLNYSATFGDRGLEMWSRAQSQINADHREFASRMGYSSPLVTFENVNLLVNSDEAPTPRYPASIRALAETKGFRTNQFEIIMVIDVNPVEQVGGYALENEKAVYVGNYGKWRAPLDQQQWIAVARTAYHHEVAHHWGWSHDWSPTCGIRTASFAPFITSPILFGWQDVDGDGTPEILDDTPYGRRH